MIELIHLTKRFGNVCAVNDLCLTVSRGEVLCLLGPNGAGKTTTIKLICGLLRPTSGTVKIAGIDVQREPVRAKRLLGYIPDMPFLYDRLTPLEFMRFTAELYGVNRGPVSERIEKHLSTFGLSEYKAVLIRDLSYGMRQRLIYAATFLHEPEALLVDEPFIGLDPYTIRMVKDLLVSKARSGMCIIVTTHILALAQDMADRICIIARGRILTMEKTELLIKKYGSNLEDVFLKLTDAAPLAVSDPEAR